MNNWTNRYKNMVVASHKEHIIIADQDDLFEYDELQQVFENDGYIILKGTTELEIRILFELNVRNAVQKYLIIAPATYIPMPDIIEKVHFKSIGLSKLFPNLDSKAIKGLSFNSLCVLSNIKHYDELGHEKTLKFLLENLYNVDFDTLKNNKAKERVLNALITVLLEKNGINPPLIQFLTTLAKPYFPELISRGLTKEHLIQFINEQWEGFVKNKQSNLDFKESILSKSLGYLFAFEYLKPVQVQKEIYANFEKSLKIGVYIDEEGLIDTELDGLIEYMKIQVGAIDDIPEQWFNIIQVMSHAKIKYLLSSNTELKDKYINIEKEMNQRFQRFIDMTYQSLFSLSGVRKPVVVSRILEHINSNPAKKKALLVIDGMNYWQWILLSKSLEQNGVSFSTGASLAYIPTITAWSRQAIFKGEKPDLDNNNSQEGSLFKAFWVKNGSKTYQVDYKKFSVHHPLAIDHMSNETKVLGMVCNDLDDIMHGSILGNNLLKTATEHWIEQSNIVQNIKELKSKGFTIFITSDHGSTEAVGIKNLRLSETVGAISRGKRHLRFTNETLFENFKSQNPDLILGRKDLSVFLKNDEAFTQENVKVITHGGSHIWEVIIPFVTV
jgi:hypothetical protein